MQLAPEQFAVRLLCGLSLLLMPAVQEKVCARPIPIGPHKPEKTTSDGSDESKRRQPPTLSAMLPDAVAPRWPNHLQLSAVNRVQPLPAATWTPRTDSGDDKPDAPSMPMWALTALDAPPPVLTEVVLAGVDDRGAWRTRRTTHPGDISINGPPLG